MKTMLFGGRRENVPGAEAAPASADALRVVHLEDNCTDAMLVQELLRAEGFALEMERVQTEEDFRSALERGGCDLILSDFSLPSFDGKRALTFAREQYPDVPFLFVSGTLGEEAAIDSLREGATDYVLKTRLTRLGPAVRRAMLERKEKERRLKAEAELRKSAELFHQITRNVTDLLAVLDTGGRWLYWSPSYRAVLNDAALVEAHDAFSEVHPEDREPARHWFEALVRDGHPSRTEFRFLSGDGDVRHIESEGSAIRDDFGKVQNILTVSRDITERKHNEEKLRQMQRELERTNKDLLRRNEEIKSFYHTVSHELKTPLTSAREFIAIVIDGLAGPVSPKQLEYLLIAKESCNQLRLLLNDLLDATRLETGKMRIEPKRASLGGLVEHVVKVITPAAAGKSIHLTTSIQPNLPAVEIDEQRITQVLMNLLNNALKYTCEGGQIGIEVAVSPQRMDFLRVAVRDTGRGIPPDQIERIFDRLYQIRTPGAASEQGIGLGLYICRELIELHRGQIWVESQPGKGSTFYFEIPKTAQTQRASVLVIDDDTTILKRLPQTLDRCGCNAITVPAGHQAMEQLEQRRPDLIIIDLNIPGMDGAGTLREIRRRFGNVPVIVHTGDADTDVMSAAMECSPVTILAKACPEEQLVEAVRMLTHRSSSGKGPNHEN